MDKIVELSNHTKRAIVGCIQNGIKEYKEQKKSQGLFENNGNGLYSLNYVFKHLRDLIGTNIKVFPFKRGPFEFVFLFDNESESIITFTSKNNIQRLSKRKTVKNPHYMDSFQLLNKGYCNEQEQLCMFEPVFESEEDARIKLLHEIHAKIGALNPKCCIAIVYDINYKELKLNDVCAELRSEHYYLDKVERLGNFINLDEDDNESLSRSVNNSYAFDQTKPEKKRLLGIAIKEDKAKRNNISYEDSRREVENSTANKK